MIMRLYVFVLLAFFVLGACSTYSSFNQPNPVTTNLADKASASIEDSTEYELLILDVGFDSWFATRNTPAMAHSNSYYKNWNYQYVIEWNQKHSQGHPYFENHINFDPFEDYGFDVNYKLYHYFLFVEEKTGIKLVQRHK
jgi:hypothetical protein